MQIPIHSRAPLKERSDYEVDSFGNVFGPKGRLTPHFGKAGYATVNFFVNGKHLYRKVHRLVAETFVSNPKGKPMVCHIDDNKKNNHYLNLYWGNAKDNAADKERLMPNFGKGEKNGRAKLTLEKVRRIKELYKSGIGLSELSRNYGVTKQQIAHIVKNKQWNY